MLEAPVLVGELEREIIDDALAFAHSLADAVAPDLLAWFGDARPEIKVDGSLVTVADVATNERIVETITGRYPSHGVVSEELETTYDGSEWCWVVDPIDGTTNFVRGVPMWSVSIALAYHGWPVLGLVDVPAAGRRYHAVQDGGAFRDGHRLAVVDTDLTDPVAVDNALVAVSAGIGRHYTMDVPLRPREMGSAALHLCMVADGSVVASVHPGPRVWDIAAGHLLVREAGGTFVDISRVPPFPMEPGDHTTRPYRFVAAASDTTAKSVAEGIHPR